MVMTFFCGVFFEHHLDTACFFNFYFYLKHHSLLFGMNRKSPVFFFSDELVSVFLVF